MFYNFLLKKTFYIKENKYQYINGDYTTVNGGRAPCPLVWIFVQMYFVLFVLYLMYFVQITRSST